MSGEIGNTPGYEPKPEQESTKPATATNKSGETASTEKTTAQDASGKPTIFAGMTRKEARKSGLLNIFIEINSNRNRTLELEEIETYKKSHPNSDLFETTTDVKVSGEEMKSPTDNTSTKKTVETPVENSNTKPAKEAPTENEKETPKLFTNMTAEQAKELGVTELFNKYSTDGETISEEDFKTYKDSLLTDTQQEEIKKFEDLYKKAEAGDIQAKKELSKIYHHMTEAREDTELLTGLKDKHLSDRTLKYFIKLGEYENLEESDIYKNATPEEREQLLGERDKYLQKQGADFLKTIKNKYLNNEQEVQAQIERLKNKQLTKVEIEELGLTESTIDTLTDEQLEYYAKEAVKRKCEACLCEILKNTFEDTELDENGKPLKDSQLDSFIRGLNGEAELDNEMKQVLIASGLFHMSKSPQKERLQQHIADNAEDYNLFNEHAPETSSIVINEVISGLDTEKINDFIQNNSTHGQLIYTSIQSYINRLQDSNPKKAQITNIIKNLPPEYKTAKPSTQTQNTTSSQSKKTSSGNTVSHTAQNASTGQIRPATQIKQDEQIAQPEQNNDFASSPINNTKKTRQEIEKEKREEIQSLKNEARELYSGLKHTTIPIKTVSKNIASPTMEDKRHHKRGNPKMLENIPPSKIERFAERINEGNIPPKIRSRIINKFSRLNDERLSEMYFNGGNDTKHFLSENKIINPIKLCKYMDKNPDVIKNAPEELQSLYENWKKSQLSYEQGSRNYDNFQPLR